jgi:folate-dependent phosphoribosylglycinamide formyltransferase PurN
MKAEAIILLAGPGAPTNIVYNYLTKHFTIAAVIQEAPVSRKEFLRRRVRRLGIWKTAGQMLFRGLAVPWLFATSRERRRVIAADFGLDDSPITDSAVTPVVSVNAEETVAALRGLNAKVVVVQGTRIISERVLKAVPATFINLHAGITPLYRGVHGAYWALVERNPQACGVTVHRVDAGVDTGGILEQALIQPTREDNFVTYPLLQLGAGLPLLKQAIEDLSTGKSETRPAPPGPSKLWSHPTLAEYLRYRLRLGVK